MREEEKEVGVVAFTVYRAYWSAVGNILAPVILLALFLMQGVCVCVCARTRACVCVCVCTHMHVYMCCDVCMSWGGGGGGGGEHSPPPPPPPPPPPLKMFCPLEISNPDLHCHALFNRPPLCPVLPPP